jgi:hypothetical protein
VSLALREGRTTEDELWLSPVNDEDGYRDGKEVWRHATKPVGKLSIGIRERQSFN